MFKKYPVVFVWLFVFCLGGAAAVFAEGSKDKAASPSPADMNALSDDISGAFAQMEDAESATEMTLEDEYYLGRAVAAEILKVYPPYTKDPALTAYLNKICQAITVNSPQPLLFRGYYVEILDTDEICAFATPGGHIFVSRGIISCAATEDALAAVIAHEAAHVQLKHAVTNIQNERTIQSLSAAQERAAKIASRNLTPQERSALFGESISGAINILFRDGYSKEQEFEADWAAGLYLISAGYDPAALGELLGVLERRLRGGNMSKTHPSPAERIASLKNTRGGTGRETLSERRARFQAAIQNSR